MAETDTKKKAYERLLEVVQIGSGARDVDQAILKFSSFYLGKGKDIPKELYLGTKQLPWEEKCEKLLMLLEIGTGYKGLVNVTERLQAFYKSKGVIFPEDRAAVIETKKQIQAEIAKKERQRQEKLAAVKKKIDKDETWLSAINLVAILLVAVLVFGSSWMAENWFSYEQTEKKTVEEPYEYVVDRVQTYVCYVTITGDCYHEESCSYLKSKRETTVYEAEQKGYRACRRCDVTERTTLEITETRYKTVTKTVTETVEPKWTVFFTGCGITAVLYLAISSPVKKQIESARKEMATI